MTALVLQFFGSISFPWLTNSHWSNIAKFSPSNKFLCYRLQYSSAPVWEALCPLWCSNACMMYAIHGKFLESKTTHSSWKTCGSVKKFIKLTQMSNSGKSNPGEIQAWTRLQTWWFGEECLALGWLDHFSSVVHPVTRPTLQGKITRRYCRIFLSHNSGQVWTYQFFFNKTAHLPICRVSEWFSEHQVSWPMYRSKRPLKWVPRSAYLTPCDFFCDAILKARL